MLSSNRTPKSPPSTLSCASWRHAACCRPSTSLQEASPARPTVTTASPAKSTRTLPVPSGVTRVRSPLPPLHLPLAHSPQDVLVHRQLSAAIGHTPLHPTLHNKSHVERILDVVNRRHTMAQRAGRASVEFYVGLALQNRGEKGRVQEDAFVIRAFRNGLGVFVSK